MREQPFWQHSCENPRTERSNMTFSKWKVGNLRGAEDLGMRAEGESEKICLVIEIYMF